MDEQTAAAWEARREEVSMKRRLGGGAPIPLGIHSPQSKSALRRQGASGCDTNEDTARAETR